MKIEKKLQKIYPTYYNLLIAQGLCEAHLQTLTIIFLKEFMKINVNTDTVLKIVKLVESNISIASVFFKTQGLKTI